jgi:SAM-dependent methyltransferase
MSSPTETFRISVEAAEVYQARFVPAIFQEWAPDVLDIAGVGPGDRVLDVACGTGVVARAAAERVGPGGTVVGVDLNDAMLTVARRLDPGIEWRQGDVDALPAADGSFDAVVCQMAMMFFPDPRHALAEMARAARPGGTVAVLVPAELSTSPGYSRFAAVVARHAGPDAVALVSTYFSLGDLGALEAHLAAAGLVDVRSRTRTGRARFASVDDFVTTEIEGSPLFELLDAATYRAIRDDCAAELADLADADGAAAPFDCHAVAGTVPG